MESKKVAIITGGSSGIGKETAISLSKSGVKVYEFSRKGESYGDVTHVSCDVTDEALVKAAVGAVSEKEGRIDILVLSAGFGISGAAEFTDEKTAKSQFDVNFFGAVNCVNAALPVMRAQKSGRIVFISSVAAVVPIPFQSFYSASKAAINSFAQSLGNEVKPFGISVTAVMPGDIKTGFTGARKKVIVGDEEYSGRISRSVEKMESDEQNGMNASAVGKYIAKIALKNRVKPLYSIRIDYKAVCVLAKLLPSKLMNKIIYSLYAK